MRTSPLSFATCVWSAMAGLAIIVSAGCHTSSAQSASTATIHREHRAVTAPPTPLVRPFIPVCLTEVPHDWACLIIDQPYNSRRAGFFVPMPDVSTQHLTLERAVYFGNSSERIWLLNSFFSDRRIAVHPHPPTGFRSVLAEEVNQALENEHLEAMPQPIPAIWESDDPYSSWWVYRIKAASAGSAGFAIPSRKFTFAHTQLATAVFFRDWSEFKHLVADRCSKLFICVTDRPFGRHGEVTRSVCECYDREHVPMEFTSFIP